MTKSKVLPEHRILGAGDTTVFMFHGAYGDGRYFENTAEVLAAEGYKVVSWSAPGYGGQDVPEEFSIDFMGDAARDLVEAEGTGTNILLGHSMGALVAPNAAMKLGDRVDGIVLSGASVGFQNRTPEDQERFLKERVAPIAEEGLTVAQYAPGLLKKMMAPGASGPLVDHVSRVVSDMKTDTFMAAMKALTSYNSNPAVAAISVPTLLLSGEFDTACPPAGMEKLHGIIPDSEYHMIEGAGHYAFAERPDVFHSHVLEFLSRRFSH
jgi:3-oxoadipate enol-lactonase